MAPEKTLNRVDSMNTFCTIISGDYIPYAVVQYESLRRFNPNTKLQVLVSDSKDNDQFPSINENLKFHPVSVVLDSPIARDIFRKYAHTNNDHLRWALKPVFISYLLSNNFDKVVFADPDIYFVGSHNFLFDELDRYSILLAPHWGNHNPLENEENFYSMLSNGIYSGGFIGANKKAIPALQWWAGACHYKMEKNKQLGLYDDQKYLDMMPVVEPSTGSLTNKGCNITNMSFEVCRRTMVDGRLKINGTYEPVFIHFIWDTINNIRNGNDPLLQPYLEEYMAALRKHGVVIDDIPQHQSFFKQAKRKILLRTRFKRFLFRLAEKL